MRRSLLAIGLLLVGGVWIWSTSAGMQERRARVEEALIEGEVGGGGAPLRGTWEAERYLLATGEEHPVQGRIVFGAGSWQVLYFVLDSQGSPRRGSAEGGDYALRGDSVVLTHMLHLSVGDAMPGLAAAPLRMEVSGAQESAREPARYLVEGERLTLFFPSGNRMTFRRAGKTGEG